MPVCEQDSCAAAWGRAMPKGCAQQSDSRVGCSTIHASLHVCDSTCCKLDRNTCTKQTATLADPRSAATSATWMAMSSAWTQTPIREGTLPTGASATPALGTATSTRPGEAATPDRRMHRDGMAGIVLSCVLLAPLKDHVSAATTTLSVEAALFCRNLGFICSPSKPVPLPHPAAAAVRPS